MNFLMLAAVSGGDAIKQLLYVLVVGIVLGILWYLVGIAPFVPDLFKKVLQWLIILVGALFLINVLLSLIGHPLITF